MGFVISLYRVNKFALQSFWRNFWLSFITVTILVLTLLIVNILVVLNSVGDTAISAVKEKIDVSISFTQETNEDLILSARGYLLSLPQVKDVKYKDREEVLRNFKLKNADNADVLDSLNEVGGNPFGGQLVITAKDPNDFAFILEAMGSPEFSPYIEDKDFQDHQMIIERIDQTIGRIQKGGIVLGIIFAFIAILIVFNTIRVAIYTHKEEIGIMRLVGASDFYVRAPFLIESVLYSLLATIVTIALVFPTLSVIEPLLDGFFETVPTELVMYYTNNFLTVFGYQFLGLIVLTVLSTAYAMRRYLKV